MESFKLALLGFHLMELKGVTGAECVKTELVVLMGAN